MLPGIAVMAASVFIPGWLLLRLAGLRGLLALAGAPALSMAFYGLAGIVLDRAGISWGWAPLLVLLMISCAVAAAAGWWIRHDARRRVVRGKMARPAGLWAAKYAQLGWANARWVALAVVGSGLLMAIPIAGGMVTPDALLQHWDAVFHTNGIQAIRETGNASTLGAMQPLFGNVGDNYYYPAVWHGVVALAPGFGSVAAAANASTFVFGVGVWLVGLAGLGHVLFTGRRHHLALTAATVVLGASFSAFPFVILSTLAQWPFGSGIALIPGTTALVVASLTGVPRGVRFVTPARFTVTCIVLAAAVGGVVLTHGSALFSLLLVLVPFALAAAGRATARRWARGNRRRILVTGVSLVMLVLAAITVVLNNPTIAAMLRYERNSNQNYLVSALHTIADFPLTFQPLGTWPVTLCVIAGFVVVLKHGLRRRPESLLWVGGGWLIVVGMVALAAGPDIQLRMLTGFWYAQSARVAAVYPVLAAPLAAIGLVALAGWVVAKVGRRTSRLTVAQVAAAWVAVGLVVTLGWHVGPKTYRFEQAYVPGELKWGTMASFEEIELLKRLPNTTDDNALILGDPANGAPFAWSVGGRHVVLPHLGESGMSADQRLLRERFNELGQDPEICEAVNRLGVTHFYQDTAGPDDGARFDEFGPGLQQEMTAGLREVDRGGTATLYEITACA